MALGEQALVRAGRAFGNLLRVVWLFPQLSSLCPVAALWKARPVGPQHNFSISAILGTLVTRL